MITYFSDLPQPSSVKQLSSKEFDISNIKICFAFQSDIKRLKLENDNVRSCSSQYTQFYTHPNRPGQILVHRNEENFHKQGIIVKLREEKAFVSYQRRRIFYEFDHLVHDFQLCFSEVLVATNCELHSFYRALFPR